MDDTFKSDFPTGIFLSAGILIITMGIVLGVFIINPSAGISVAIVTTVVTSVIGLAMFQMYHLTGGPRSKYVIKKYGSTMKMVLRSDLVKQEETRLRFEKAAAEKEISKSQSSEDNDSE